MHSVYKDRLKPNLSCKTWCWGS